MDTRPPTPVPPISGTLKFWCFVAGQVLNGILAVELAPAGSVWLKLCNLGIFVLGSVGLYSSQKARAA